MKIWIVCTGEKEGLWPARCDGERFAALCRLAQEEEPEKREEKKLPWEGGSVLIAPTPAAKRTADLCIEGGCVAEEELLAPVLSLPWTDRGEHPLWLWREMAALQRKLGSKRQPESRREISARAEALIARLEQEGKDCVLVADCLLTVELLDRARLRNYTRARTGIFGYRPWERVLLTKRDTHCGGCGHNCSLSSPGCGVGKDKAARQKKL